MEPEQDAGSDGQVPRQVGRAEQAGEAGESVRSALHIPLREEMQ